LDESLAILRVLHHPAAGQVRAQLAALSAGRLAGSAAVADAGVA
jgi:hypothetical protein